MPDKIRAIELDAKLAGELGGGKAIVRIQATVVDAVLTEEVRARIIASRQRHLLAAASEQRLELTVGATGDAERT